MQTYFSPKGMATARIDGLVYRHIVQSNVVGVFLCFIYFCGSDNVTQAFKAALQLLRMKLKECLCYV